MRFLLLSILLPCLACQTTQKLPPSRPNVLLIMVDDMGVGDLGREGNPYTHTPHLDLLALESVNFRNFYVSSVCAPTRASLLTGRYHQRTGVRSVTNGYEMMVPDEWTLAEFLQPLGYRCGIFGKWHLGEYHPSLPMAQGFEEFIGFRTGHTANYWNAALERNGQVYPTAGYLTDVLTEEAMRFMQESEQPFFCYLPYQSPHTPLQIDSTAWQKFRDQGLSEKVARLYAMVENVDHNLGRLREFLASEERYANTILIFLSDNGPVSGWRLPQEQLRYNAGLRDQKFSVYEGGIRTVSFWSWPEKWPAHEVQAVGAHIDLVPTLGQIVGFEAKEAYAWDGRNLLPELEGKDSLSEPRPFFQNYALGTLREPAPQPGGIFRLGKWKMVNGTELYDLRQDPGEQTNLAESDPNRLAEMNQAYLDWYQDVHRVRNFVLTPIEVGHAAENPVALRPHHGRVIGGDLHFLGKRGLAGERIGRHPNGVDGDWIGHWTSAEDLFQWEVEIVEPGTYAISLLARGETNKAGKLQVQIKDQVLSATSLLSSSNEWQPLELGTIELAVGSQSIALSCLEAQIPDLAIHSLSLHRLN
ncbi:MAG: arylsulfatase [Bacteroidota bacterium]